MTGLVDAAGLADVLGVTRGYVYEHADELGAIRLGAGPKARLRFSVETALERLTTASPCFTGRRSDTPSAGLVEPKRARPRPRSLGTTVELLPIRPQGKGVDRAA